MGRQTERERTNLKCQLLELDTGRKQKITARIACRAAPRLPPPLSPLCDRRASEPEPQLGLLRYSGAKLIGAAALRSREGKEDYRGRKNGLYVVW